MSEDALSGQVLCFWFCRVKRDNECFEDEDEVHLKCPPKKKLSNIFLRQV